MHLDFASQYARRSDDEIRLLIKDRHNLVDEARDALDVEVQKRRNKTDSSRMCTSRKSLAFMLKKTTRMEMRSSFDRGN
jgi:hypothetical protein